MKLLPLIKGEIKLKTNSVEFKARIRELTEKDVPLISPINIYSSQIIKSYAREFYENSFMLWKIQTSASRMSPLIFTTINGRLIEKDGQTFLKYHIRFNIWSNLLMIISTLISIYILYDLLFLSERAINFLILMPLTIYPIFIWTFNSCATNDVDFLKRLTGQNIC